MVSKFKGKISKIVALLSVVAMVIAILIGQIYSTDDNHYVIDVVKESATESDENLQITEKIVKGEKEQYFDSKELKYEVEFKNIAQDASVETQVAIVIDSSYSMETNDMNNVVKTKAIEFAHGILDNVKKSRVSISNNNNMKLGMTNYKTAVATNKNSVTTQVNALKSGEGSDSNIGLDNAIKSFSNAITSTDTINKYIIVFTDATDEVTEKLQSIDSSIKVISILVDMTSDSYITENGNVNGDVYVLLSELTETDIPQNINLLDTQKIYNEMNNTVKNIELVNTFSDEILTYFNISDITADKGNVEKTETGYKWNIDKIDFQETAKLTYSIELRTNMDINAGIIFEELYTNKKQEIRYNSLSDEEFITLNGTDSREGTESTVIKICQGYDLKIKAVNESNTDLQVEDVKFKVVGINENEEEVCNLTKTTDSNGYITITPEDARALRGDGTITFTVSPTVNKVGYTSTDSVTFKINSNKETKKVKWVDIGTDLDYNINEDKRLVEVVVPINSQRVDFELKVSELNNNNVVISGAEFELIQPKLNNKYEMDVLTGITDENGIIHFSPTVMTKDGTYSYILRQVSAPEGYEVTALTLITMIFENGKITSVPETQFNPHIVNKELLEENHVLVEIGNECVAQDPFNLQINLQDSSDGTKLEGVTYLVKTTNANNISRSEYVKTDANGQVNTNIYGNGNLRIEITEQSPKAGYVEDTQTKELIINRDNKIITIWNASPTDLDRDQSPSKEDIIVNLFSQKKLEQNIVKVNIVDSEEIDVPVGAGIVYTLTEMTIKPGTESMVPGASYTGISDRNGEIKFIIDTRTQGNHLYQLKVDGDLLPEEYSNETNEQQILVNLTFDAEGFVIGTNIGEGSEIVNRSEVSRVENGEYIEHTAFITIAYKMNLENTVEFKIQLSDKDNSKTKLEDAAYNIDIEWDIEGETRTKNIKERKTNSKGEISTRIYKGDEVRIVVKQVKARLGYTVDLTTQEIYVTFNNNGTMKIVQTPYDLGATNTEEPNQGAQEVSKVLVYKHLNKKRTTDDTYLNLTITKKDLEGLYKDGKNIGIKSETLLDKNNNKLDLVLTTGRQGSIGTITLDYEKYIQDSVNNEIIKVPDIEMDGKEVIHNLEISELEVDNQSPTKFKEKPGTTVIVRLIYRYLNNRVVLTNAETIYGNRLVENKVFSSSSDTEEGIEEEDKRGVFLSNVLLELYTDYDEIGNLSLDLRKKNENGAEIAGALYTIKVTNPDNTVTIKENIPVSNGENSSDIEISGLNVNVGSIIELKETKAPIGYEINQSTETLEVTEISEDGLITLRQNDIPYSPNRLEMKKLASSITSAGKLKTNYQLTFTDYELNVFEFDIETKDKASLKGVGGFEFRIDSSKGATNKITTESDGFGKTKIGGNGTDETITYTVTLTEVAEYYKPLKSAIKVNVVYTEAGTVDEIATQNANNTKTDSNYGTLWNITNVSSSGFGKIGIQILAEHQDPLVVKVQTIDKITNAKIDQVQYKITPSEELEAIGSTSINVGYATQTGLKTYTIEQTSLKNSYQKLEDRIFKVTYQNEILTQAEFLNNSAEEDTIEITGKKEVTLKLYVDPKVPFEFTNLAYFDPNMQLQGANFEVISQRNQDTGSGITDSIGKTAIYSDILTKEQDIIFKIRQTKAATEYATVEDFYVKVTFNENMEITHAELVDQYGASTTDNKFVTIGIVKTSTYSNHNSNDKGIVTIQVLNYPEFKININNVDRRDGTTPIVGTEYSVKSTYTQSDNSIREFTETSGVLTNTDGIGIAHLDKTKENTVVTYTITETKSATGYQSLGTEIKIEVTFDGEGYVSAVQLVNQNNLSSIASVSKIDTVVNVEDNFIVNIELKNNPILKFNLTATDSQDPNIKIKDIGLQIVSKTQDNTIYSYSSATNRVNQTQNAEASYTDINGYTASYLDRTLENKDMYYTIKQVQKSPGYEWIKEEIIIKVAFSPDGKISTITPEQGEEYVNITSFDSDNFEISLDIYNDEIKEFGIHLIATDTYNNKKKLNDMKVEAFLTTLGGNSYTSDGEYELIGDNALLTGEDKDNDGKPDITYGEDYKSMGQYTKGAGTRTLRLIIKNDISGTGKKAYYLDSHDGSNSGNSVGHYEGNSHIADAKYQNVVYDCLINVTFDDEGKITDTKLLTGLNEIIGNWLVDDRYIDVSIGGNYKLNITMKFFPMFELNLNAMDNYTYQSEIDENGKPISLSGAKFNISTQRHTTGYREEDEFVKAGYIGAGNTYGMGSIVKGDIYEATDTLFVPIEKNKERLFYIFEEIEPTNYQKTNPWRYTYYYERLVGIIKVTFNEYGEIDYDNSIVRKVEDNTIHPYIAENGNSYLSSNNIPEYKYYYDKTEANRNINFYIGYALTTKINITAVDDISGSPITNIRIDPFINNTYCTEKFYQYVLEAFKDTNNKGFADIKYWGAATQNNVNQYIIKASRYGDNFNGYLFPSDMAKSELGGSGNQSDYYTKLDVTYGENGKISNVKSIGADLWGDDNVSKDITWDPNTGIINIKMLFSRKLQMRLNKVDYYDSTINNLVAKFDVISDKGLNTSISSQNMKPMGKVYKDTTVKYTLSETQVPNGYYPLTETIDYYVTFDKDGDISTNSIKSSNEYFGVVSTSKTTEKVNKTSPDLTINIKNKPAFNLDIKLIDKFYKDLGLADGYFKVTNNKGDIALGNPQTDENGYVKVVTGPVYPGETVKYTISQTNTVHGYYQNSTKIELEVEFNDIGKVQNYKLLTGNDVINNFNSTGYMNTREISMQIMNMPKDLKIGLYKFDETTDQAMDSVQFTIIKEDMNSGAKTQKTIITESNGYVIDTIDTFVKTTNGKTIKYTIHEDKTPASYRTMQDVVFIVRYNPDGSIASYNQVPNNNGILNTDVIPEIAIGKIKYSNEQKVHFSTRVPNDNSYDIIIKNEDANYEGFGIEGSKFDVSVNGETYTPELTDVNGKSVIKDLTESGEINIKIAQKETGDGYRFDVDNNVEINLEKGIDVYSIDLKETTNGFIDDKNAATDKAIVKVDETFGTITITFKNETKTELTLFKQDINSKVGLKDAEFEVIAQQIDNTGNSIGEAIILTNEENRITDVNGQIYFDLGVAPQSQIWTYTFKEITPPEGYNPIIDLVLTITYDQYGRVVGNMTSNKLSRLYPTVSHIENENCREIYAIIYNGDISPAYKVKVVTEDADTGKRINRSSIYMNITDEQGKLITVEPKTIASAKNGSTSITGNLGINGLIYSDAELEAEGTRKPIIIEKGLTYIDNIDYEGLINIEVSQTKAANGYIFGNQKTDANIKINTRYIPHLDEDPTVEFDVIDNDGLDIIVDNANRIITIKILNESEVLFDITTQEYNANQNDEIKYITGANYVITSEIQTSTSSMPTELNVTTSISNQNGNIKQSVGKSIAGKTVLYTIKQNTPLGYKTIEDIQIQVQYDSRGYIKYYEILSSEDNCYIDEKQTTGRNIKITVMNKKEIKGYTVNIEKRTMDTDSELNNYNIKLPGAKYEITVEQQLGGQKSTTWVDVTNEDGIIKGLTFNGFGYITISIKELEAPEGYKVDNILRYIKLYRDPNDGEMTKVDANVNMNDTTEFDEKGNNIITLNPIDGQEEDKFTLIINKISSETGSFIINNQAQFKVEFIQKDENGNITYQDELGIKDTDLEGRLILDNLKIPGEVGEYKLVITELKAPEGYVQLSEPIEIPVTLDIKNDNIVIENINVEGEENVSISRVKEQLIGLNIINKTYFETFEDKYQFNITNIDIDTKEPILENQSIFRLEDEAGNRQYIETDIINGKLQMPYFDLPEISEFETSEIVERNHKLTQIMAPKGYLVDSTPINVNIKFAKNEENKVIIQEIKVIKEQTEEQKEIEVTEEDKIISFKFENKKGELTNNVNRGTYTINISKVDGDTENQTTKRRTFEITLENGQKITASTDDNGNMQIKDIKVPQTVTQNLGPYSYVIQEIKTVDGNELIDEYIVMELTFNELIDPDTGRPTGFYGIDNTNDIPVLTEARQATISSYTEEKVNIIIGDKSSSKYVIYEDNVENETIEVPEQQEKRLGKDVILSEMVPEREGFIFKGWSETKESTQAEYQPGDTYTQHENITLYAIWEGKEYILTFDYNGGTGNIINKEIKNGEPYGELPEASKEEYKFIGWYDENGNKVESSDIANIKSNITLRAEYENDNGNDNDNENGNDNENDNDNENKKYFVTFKNDDGAEITTIEVEHGATGIFTGELPEKSGVSKGYQATFIGWDNEEALQNVTQDLVLTATYEISPIVYTITYYNLKQADNSNNPTTYTIEDPSFELKGLEDQDNHLFIGWFKSNEDNAEEITSIDTSKLGNIILYAKWQNDELYLSSKKYKVGEKNIDNYEDGDIYLDKIEPKTTVADLIANCDTNGVITVIDKEGNILKEDDLVGTGMTIKAVKDDKEIILTAVVMGDLSGDGKVTATDLSALNQTILYKTTLEEVIFKAADLDDNKKITATDLSTVNQTILKLIELKYSKDTIIE